MTAIIDEEFQGLSYPWGKKEISSGNTPIEVAPGVYWARFSMPFSLDHINLWLLEDTEGWTVIDTCLDLPESRQHWEKLFSGFMAGRPINRVICTHMHPDHVGLAGWLTKHFNAEFLMTQQEFLMCKTLTNDTGKAAPQSALNFYQAAGYSQSEIDEYKQHFGGFGQAIYQLPDQYRRLVDRDTLLIGSNEWQIIIGNGHSPEHACLYCPSLKLLISGDQILPSITSNVSVYPFEPQGNPLKDWLDSCSRLRNHLPSDLLVLPAHESPFYGLDVRLTQLIDSHQSDLETLCQFLDTPKRVIDCFPVLFKRKIKGVYLGLATGEALAHLNYLISIKKVVYTSDSEGVYWYSCALD